MRRHNDRWTTRFVRSAVPMLMCLLAVPVRAAENDQVVTDNGTAIRTKAWSTESFPLRWRLSNGGVVNNDTTGSGTPAVTDTVATEDVDRGIQTWTDVSNAGLSVFKDGKSPKTASGCDFVNLVTWADDPGVFVPGIIAKGVTTTYIGPDVTLDAQNRKEISCANEAVPLSEEAFQNGFVLNSGTILDMDLTFNSRDFDFARGANPDPKVADILTVTTQLVGGMLGLSASSLPYTDSKPVTLFPIMSNSDVTLQKAVTTLEYDDMAATGQTYPASGFYPGGTTPFTSGAVSGRISGKSGVGRSGVRLWAYSIDDLSQPVYETVSVTAFDTNPDLEEGDYIMAGMEPGEYYVCAVPWKNGSPSDVADDPERYNKSSKNGRGNTDFQTACFDNVGYESAMPRLKAENSKARKIRVTDGETEQDVDFVLAAQPTDFVIVLDKSGSMGLDSSASGKTKLAAEQDAAHALIDALALIGGHRLGLVQYSDKVIPFSAPFDLQALTEDAAATAHKALDSIKPEGRSNIAAGIDAGIAQLTDISAPNGRQAIIIFSDGRQSGSGLEEMKAVAADNDIELYSVGFGTDIDDATLSDIALGANGFHVTEPDLDPSDLAKYTLHAAASASGLAVLLDQTVELQTGATKRNKIYMGPDDRSLVVAVNWTESKKARASLTLITPGGCKIRTDEAPAGTRTRAGETYFLAEVALPVQCNGAEESEGEWSVLLTGAADISRRTPETISLGVFSRSLGGVAVRTAVISNKPSLIAHLFSRGRVVSSKGVTFAAELIGPARNTGDSAQEDETGQKGGPAAKAKPAEEGRGFFVRMYDDGTHGDEKAGDGIFVGPIRTDPTGVYRVRIKGTYATPRLIYKKEASTSFYYSPDAIHVMPAPSPAELNYVD